LSDKHVFQADLSHTIPSRRK